MSFNDLNGGVSLLDDSSRPPRKARMNPARRRAALVRAQSNQESSFPIPLQTSKPVPAANTSQFRAKKPIPMVTVLSKPRDPPVGKINTSNIVARAPVAVGTVSKRPTELRSSLNTLGLSTPALVTGGLVGCAASAAFLLGVSLWYNFAGAEAAILTAKAAKLCVDNLASETIASLKAGTYSTDEALDVLRRTTLAYSTAVPGGVPVVESIFREVNIVRKQRGRDVEVLVQDAFDELSEAGRKGASAKEMQVLIVKHLDRLSGFAASTTQDVVGRNPKLKPYKAEAHKAFKAQTPGVPTLRVNIRTKSYP